MKKTGEEDYYPHLKLQIRDGKRGLTKINLQKE